MATDQRDCGMYLLIRVKTKKDPRSASRGVERSVSVAKWPTSLGSDTHSLADVMKQNKDPSHKIEEFFVVSTNCVFNPQNEKESCVEIQKNGNMVLC